MCGVMVNGRTEAEAFDPGGRKAFVQLPGCDDRTTLLIG